ncbi:MAG: hypothetical protein F6K40_06105 [Okeania sp. SIO3I5]|uniref:hypothetical protein n=1 Tax=Okeania sp. SIO3I5 TaxID=2607805 RepID=UPI0013BAEF83|nr:hypothetical protein [Okeania sp. SIO3I5]NEQ35881.1 hypothetical protein [Okeania sp. SIO3I5]
MGTEYVSFNFWLKLLDLLENESTQYLKVSLLADDLIKLGKDEHLTIKSML